MTLDELIAALQAKRDEIDDAAPLNADQAGNRLVYAGRMVADVVSRVEVDADGDVVIWTEL